MDLKQLATFREVAERSSVTAAAELLHCTPSAVSQQIRALERELGVRLTERTGRGIRVTAAGRALADASPDVAVAVQRARDECLTVAGQTSGTVLVAAFQSAGQMFFPRLLSAAADEPTVTIRCMEHDVPQQEFPGLTADHDVVLAHRPDTSQRWHGRGLRVLPLLTEPMDVAVPHDHPLADRDYVRPREIIDLPWITVHEGFPVARVLDALSAAAGQPAGIVHRINDFHTIQALVAAGHGVALLPRYSTGGAVRLVALRGFRASREVEALARRERAGTPVVRRVLDMLRDVAQQIGTRDRR